MARSLEERLVQKLKEVENIKARINEEEKKKIKPLKDEVVFSKLLEISIGTYYNKKKSNSLSY